jgi:hypothetical protein
MALKQDLQRVADEHATRLNELMKALADKVYIRESLRSASFDLAAEQAFQLFSNSFEKALAGQASVSDKLVALSTAYVRHIRALRSVFGEAIEANILQQNLRAMFGAYKSIYSTG